MKLKAVAAAVTALLLATLAAGAKAQGSGPSAAELAEAAEHRWTEYREGLQSKSSITRFSALAAALADPNIGICGEAIWMFIHANTTLQHVVVTTPGGKIDPSTVPNPEILGLNWHNEDKTFKGVVRSGGTRGAEGKVIGGQIYLRFNALSVSAGLLDTARKPAGPIVPTRCRLTLALSSDRGAMEGPMYCDGVRIPLPINMPLG